MSRYYWSRWRCYVHDNCPDCTHLNVPALVTDETFDDDGIWRLVAEGTEDAMEAVARLLEMQ